MIIERFIRGNASRPHYIVDITPDEVRSTVEVILEKLLELNLIDLVDLDNLIDSAYEVDGDGNKSRIL